MECSLCCEAFTEEGAHVPRNLDCGHTFCTVCIERLETHAPLRQGPRCPDCRAVIRFNRRTVPSLPKNYKLLELIREQRAAAAAAAAQQNHHHQRQRHPHHHHHSHHHHPLSHSQQSSQQKTQRTTPPTSSQSSASSAMTSCSTAVGLPVVPESRPRHGMMYATAAPPPPPPGMGSYLSPPTLIATRLEEWMPLRPVPSLPDGRPMRVGASFGEDVRPTTTTTTATTTTTRVAATSASEETVSRNRTPSVLPSVRSPEALPDVPEAVENGRAVTGPNGRLVCKFFQEGTCRYGHNCWFHHPVLNENKSMCRHWMKGQCRMGLMCNFRHGKPPCPSQRSPAQQHPSHQQQQQRPQPCGQRQRPPRDPSAPGPSGEGPAQPVRRSRPSVVIFVTGCGSSVHHPSPPVRQERSWGNLPTQAGAAGRSFSPESERFFDDFSSSSFHQQ